MLRSQSSPAKTEYYDQFLFIDSLSNRSIVPKDIRRNTKRQTTKISHDRESEQHEIKQLNECIDLLKGTLNFKIKHFKEEVQMVTLESEKEGNQTVRKRRIVRNLLKNTISQKNKEEFQKYLQCPTHRLDKNLIELSRKRHITINKENVTKIVDALQTKQFFEETPKKNTEIDFQKEPIIQKLSFLEREIEKDVKGKLRRMGLFLVEEKKSNVLKQNQTFRPKNLFSQKKIHLEILKEKRWQPASLGSSQIKVKSTKRKNFNLRRNSKAIDKLFQSIQSGELSDIEVLVGRHSIEILKERDKEGNSPFHLCAKLNKGLMFQWLLRMRGVESLLEKNEDGDTPISIAVRQGHREVLNFIPTSLL